MSKKAVESSTSKIVLDKPTKRVYNIRKDEAEVKALYEKYLRDVTAIGRSGPHNDKLLSYIDVGNALVRKLCDEAGVSYPVLAGGALRDFVFNRPPKDYDYFFNCANADEAYETIDKLLLHCGEYTEGGPDDGSDNYEREDADFEGVYGVFNIGNGDIQLIVGVWPEDPAGDSLIYHRFDLSVCQAEMTLEDEDIKFSDAFMDTLTNKVIHRYNESAYTKIRHDRLIYSLGLKASGTTSLKVGQWKTYTLQKFAEVNPAAFRDVMQQVRFVRDNENPNIWNVVPDGQL